MSSYSMFIDFLQDTTLKDKEYEIKITNFTFDVHKKIVQKL